MFVVPEQRSQVLERLLAVELRRVDEAHEDIADVSPVERLVEERVLPVKDGLLQRTLADKMPRPRLCRVPTPFRVFVGADDHFS
jgi:hypothetical protein